VEGTDPTPVRTSSWARRSAELGARIRDLHERNAELSASSGPPDLEERRSVGSTTDQVAKAEALARVASMRAFEAMKRTAVMRLHAASAHDRAAHARTFAARERAQAAIYRAHPDGSPADGSGKGTH